MTLADTVKKWLVGQKANIKTFIGIHYIYITAVAILGSIIVYPARNLAYIDALFLATGSVTQAGLNTQNLNEIKLYQQITFYLQSNITSVVFVHTGVVFFRFWSFEKHFKHIAANSKLQSRLRRTATMARRQESRDRDIEAGIELPSTKSRTLTTSSAFREDEKPQNVHNDSDNNTSDLSDPSTSDPSTSSSGPKERFCPPHERDIKFGELPHPSRRAPEGVAPDDMFRSLHMMQRNRRKSSDLGDGPPLVIPGPREMPDDDLPVIEDEKPQRYNLRRTKSMSLTTSPSNPMKERTSPVSTNSDADRRNSGGLINFVRSKTLNQISSSNTVDQRPLQPTMSTNYLSWEPTVGRNSLFVGLTEAQKEELGGVEYCALKLLSKILVCYYIGIHVLSAVALLPWIWRVTKYRLHVQSDGVDPTWWAIFTSMSSFNDLGYTLTEKSMMFFIDAAYVQLFCSFLIIIGNTGFPCMLRFIIWIMFKFSPEFGQMHESLGFLLDHPRRCFTLLFPSSATWWLFAVLVILNGVGLIFFIVLDIHNETVTTIPIGYRICAGFFQAVSARTAGFSVVNLSALSPALQVNYMIMMYISVLPIAISVRRTNVYEEQSLGIYGHQDEEDHESPSYVVSHLRKQLSFDLWFIALGLFIACIAEGDRISQGDFDVFSVLFEVVSAYGTVGMSLGYPDYNPALSGQFNVIGKLVIIAMMLRGRHRGLPYKLDRAIILKGDTLSRVDTMQSSRVKHTRQMSSNFPISDQSAKAQGTSRDEPATEGLRRREVDDSVDPTTEL